MDESIYLSYLLRLWKVKSGGSSCWRASLESPVTGERQGFSDLEALFTYLEWVVEDPSSQNQAPPNREEE